MILHNNLPLQPTNGNCLKLFKEQKVKYECIDYKDRNNLHLSGLLNNKNNIKVNRKSKKNGVNKRRNKKKTKDKNDLSANTSLSKSSHEDDKNEPKQNE